MKLSLKFKEVWKHLGFAFFMVVSFLGLTVYFYGFQNFQFEPVSGAFFLLPVLIVVLLMVEYLKNERRRKEIIITEDYVELRGKNGNDLRYHKEKIDGITMFGGVSFFQKTKFAREFRWLPFEIFHFAEVRVKDAPPIYITSLMDTDLFYKLPKLGLFQGKTKYKKIRLASIWWNTLSD